MSTVIWCEHIVDLSHGESGVLVAMVKVTPRVTMYVALPPPPPCRWLDSARSLYEQDVETNSHMYLRFKYYSIMDLDMRVSESAVGGGGVVWCGVVWCGVVCTCGV